MKIVLIGVRLIKIVFISFQTHVLYGNIILSLLRIGYILLYSYIYLFENLF